MISASLITSVLKCTAESCSPRPAVTTRPPLRIILTACASGASRPGELVIVPHRLDHAVGADAVGELQHPATGILVRDVDHVIGPQAAGGLQPERLQSVMIVRLAPDLWHSTSRIDSPSFPAPRITTLSPSWTWPRRRM